jgi:type I restriction enzyme M protein
VSLEEVAANDFNLSVERYVLEPAARRVRDMASHAETALLEDIAELSRPQALPKPKDNGGTKISFFEVGAADIDETGIVRQPSKELLLTPELIQHTRRARLEEGDLLLVVKGSVGKVGLVRGLPKGANWLASQSFVVLRLRQHGPLRDPRVLHRFLSSEIGQTTLQSLRVGTTVLGLQMADVRRLPIVVPKSAEQKGIAEQVEALFDLQDRILEMRDQLTKRQRTIWPDGTGA